MNFPKPSKPGSTFRTYVRTIMRITIKFRLGAAFAAVVLLLACVAVYGLMSLATVNQTMNEIINGHARRLELAMQVNIEQAEQVRALRNAFLRATDEERYGDYRTAEQRVLNLRKAIEAGLTVATETGRPVWLELMDFTKGLEDVTRRIEALHRDQGHQIALDFSNAELGKVTLPLRDKAQMLQKMASDAMAKVKVEADQSYATTRDLLIAVAGIAFVIAVGAAIWLSVSITRGIGQAVSAVREVAEGDLTKTVAIRGNN